MFTLLSTIIDYVLDKVQPLYETEESHNDHQFSPLDEAPFLIRQQENLQKKVVEGKVSHVFHGHGLVNNEVYFSMDSVMGEDRLQVGDQVFVIAVQHNGEGGWHAQSIQLLHRDWDNVKKEEEDRREIDLDLLQQAVVVGKVTQYQYREGFIDGLITFSLEDCCDGFVPQRGDWVSARVEVIQNVTGNDGWGDNIEEVKIAKNIHPARKKESEGVVTAVMRDHGYIDGEIYFTYRACLNGYRPRKNDVVKVWAVESKQGQCDWRAISIVPLSSESTAYRSKQFKSQAKDNTSSFLVPGQRPQSFSRKVILPVKLPHFSIPESLSKCVREQEELTDYFPVLMQELTFRNYVNRMSTLLHLEEIQQQMDIREFDLNRVCLHPVGEFLALTVPGLAEGRPSVLIGDKIILTSPSDPDGPSYEGFVHELTCTDVHLKFTPEFHSKYNGEDYNVQFTFTRTPLRRCHQAVSLAVQYLGSAVILPTEVKLKPPQIPLEDVFPSPEFLYKYGEEDQGFSIFNKGLNVRQKTAVRQILLGQGRPTPYVIFGPPGTGKTITVVEAILQVLTRIPSCRILACTPSNSAADLIAERLHQSGEVSQTDMVRLNAFQRTLEAIPEPILPYCRFADDLSVISRYRVIVSTCVMAGSLYGLGLSAGHFTHVFVDEAGQATEPETLIPVGLLSAADGQTVLAGDPQQLGPILMSPFAKMYGLELSFLERLMLRHPYQRNEDLWSEEGNFDPTLVTMLVDNYRSHAEILALPSQLFYYNELQAKADPSVSHTLAELSLLPTKGLPVVFHGSRGEDLRENNSPSWFNPSETMLVVQYLQNVLREGVKADDIGIITPYRKQVEKIRLMMDRLAIPEVKVGSVEEFQGQERQVIIISTVRSNEKLIGFDVRHTLGFLSNPKRFNVAITRAQALLIIIGNPFVLTQDPNWRKLITHCRDKGAYTGCELPDLSQFADENESQ